MEAIHIDAHNGRKIPAHEVRSGITGFISWGRLNAVLRAAGELRDNERLISFQIDDRGLSFRVEPVCEHAMSRTGGKMVKRRKSRLTSLRFRKKDPAHNLLAATQHWVKANGGALVVVGSIGLLDQGASRFQVCVGCVGRRPERKE